MKKGIRIVLLILGLLVIAAGISLIILRLEPWLSADAAFKKAETNAALQKYVKAFRYIKMASDKKPGDPKFAWAATQMASAIGNANAAYLYAQKTWKAGRKERDVLHALVQYSFFSDKKQKLDYALSLVGQMGDNIDKDDTRAELYAGFGEFEQAGLLWEKEYARTPQPATAVKLARIYLQEGKDTAAFLFLTSCREQRKLNEDGYGLLARLFAKRGNSIEAERCYRDGAEEIKGAVGLEYDHAMFLLDSKEFERAASILDSMITKYPENKKLEAMRILTLLEKGDYAGTLRECDKSTAPIAIIAPLRARTFIRLNRLAEAEAAFDTALAHKADLRTRLEFGNILLFGLRKTDKAREVFMRVHKEQPSEPVSNFGLANIAIDAKDAAGAKKYVEAVLSQKKPAVYAYLLLAQINLLENKPAEALGNCDKVLAAMPGFEKALFVKAQAYAASGDLGKSDEVLSSLIRGSEKGGVASKADWVKRALVPVKIREKKYGDALSIVNDLGRSGETDALRRTRFEIYGLSGNLTKARELLASMKNILDKNELCNYMSWLAELEGDTTKAASILERDLSNKEIFIRWAVLRLQQGAIEGVMERAPKDSMTISDWSYLARIAQKNGLFTVCALCYKNALKYDENNAALLNNFAWACMQTPGFNRDEVIKAAKKAYMSLSSKPEVLQTYAEALNKCDKAPECIKILQDKPAQTKESPALLYQLTLAYEKTGDLRGAISSLRMMLTFSDSSPDWPSDAKRGDLETKVEKIKQQLGQ